MTQTNTTPRLKPSSGLITSPGNNSVDYCTPWPPPELRLRYFVQRPVAAC